MPTAASFRVFALLTRLDPSPAQGFRNIPVPYFCSFPPYICYRQLLVAQAEKRKKRGRLFMKLIPHAFNKHRRDRKESWCSLRLCLFLDFMHKHTLFLMT